VEGAEDDISQKKYGRYRVREKSNSKKTLVAKSAILKASESYADVFLTQENRDCFHWTCCQLL
jgi:hypothetical protein